MTLIKLRRGTASQWSSANTILAQGEPGYETDTGKYKIGTGSANWNSLPYFIDKTGTDAAYAPFGATQNASDAQLRDRSTHTGSQAQSTITGLTAAIAAKADLVGGFVPTSQLPSISINDIFTVSSQAAMLALTAQRGDMAIRTDVAKTFVLANETPTTLANWLELPGSGSGGGAVTSVNSQIGIVVLGKADVGLGNVDNTSDVNKPVSSAAAAAISSASTSAVTYARLPAGVAIAVDYYKAGGINGAANAWPSTRPHARTDCPVIWRGPTDPGNTLAIAGDTFQLVGA